MLMVPITKADPSSYVSMSRPPSPVSKARVPVRPSLNWNRPLGCHHWAISVVKRAKASAGSQGTRAATRTRGRSVIMVLADVRGECLELLGPASLGLLEPPTKLG